MLGRSASIPSSTPTKSATWGFSTPFSSLSDLSTLATASSPSRGADSDIKMCDAAPPLLRPTMTLSGTSPANPVNSILPVWMSSHLSLNIRAMIRLDLIAAARHAPTGIGAWIGFYLICSLALTLHNKHTLNRFPFPWMLTATHAFSAALGSWICAWRGVFKPAPLAHPTTPLLAIFSVLYSANIVASNASLRLVGIATHQVIRAATPLFVIFFAWVRMGRVNVSSAKLKSLTPVILGVCFATYGEYTYTRTGLALTLLGTILAALKTMFASWVVRAPTTPVPSLLFAETSPGSRTLPIHFTPKSASHYSRTHVRRSSIKRIEDEGYLSGEERPGLGRSFEPSRSGSGTDASSSDALHPLDVLFRLSPLACIQCLIVAWGSGEISGMRGLKVSVGLGWDQLGLRLATNGALAFILNYVSFMASRRAGALSMTVAANVKQVLTVLLALLVFDPQAPSFTHILGIGLTLIGGICYGFVEVREGQQREAKAGL